MPIRAQLREIHHCQPADQKEGVGLKVTDAAKVKKGKVGGEDVERRTRRDWSQTTGAGGGCVWEDVVGGCVR